MSEDKRSDHDVEETRRHLEGYLSSYPGLRGRICRVLLLHLHTQGSVRIEDVYRRARRAEAWNVPADPNRPSATLWAADERELINDIVLDLAASFLTPKEVDDIIWAAHRRDEAQSLESLSRMNDVPLDLVAEKVGQYASMPSPDGFDAPVGTRVALIRRFVSQRVDYIAIAKHHLQVRDLSWILDRVVCTERGFGTVGGKAAGMILAWAILHDHDCGSVALPETIFVLTDAYQEFKTVNGLTHLEDHKYRPIDEIRDDYPAIREVFRNAEFPPRIADLLRVELNNWGETPLIVRSSSVLEDNFGAAFSGIYKSLFLANQGSLEQRLRDLLGAISEIYASVFSPDAVQYRRQHHLLDHDERMAIMIQRVVGTRHENFFLPSVAGVAFSRNDYRWSSRIRREDGLVRLVLGLGTHAVDRVGDYARMVPLKAPSLRPEGTAQEIFACSQKKVDVVDLDDGGFRTIHISDALKVLRPSGIAEYVSVLEDDGRLTCPVGTVVPDDTSRLCVTFERFLQKGQFTERMHRMLRILEDAYHAPVDLEFAVDGDTLYILQNRPLGGTQSAIRTPVPEDVPPEDRIFSARRYVNSGVLSGIEYVVLIDPKDYGTVGSAEEQHAVAGVVGHLNDVLASRRFVLMGPGRWGSKDRQLGVQVTYADICNASALIEIARSAHGYTPEPSFGTHFFQDLVEASILYLPVYPDEPGVVFNEEFLRGSPNSLAELSPRDAALEKVVRVLDIGAICPGRSLELVLDGEAQQALCFLQ